MDGGQPDSAGDHMPPWSYNRTITRRHVNGGCFNNPQCVPATLQMASKQGLRPTNWAFSDVCSKHDESDGKSFKGLPKCSSRQKFLEKTLEVDERAEMKTSSHFRGGVQNIMQLTHYSGWHALSENLQITQSFHSLTRTCCQGFHVRPFWLRKKCALLRIDSHKRTLK